ncbi:MAG TPA: VOC family protein [Myxococcota bacterium]|jgi:PhnB protein|nr:VOC family protein [Myxococcota bacterium]
MASKKKAKKTSPKPKARSKPAARRAAPKAPAKRPAKPPNMTWVAPYLIARDVDGVVSFYERAFGFKRRSGIPGPDGKLAHAELTYKDAVIMVGRPMDTAVKTPAESGGCPLSLYVYVDDVDAFHARACGGGAQGTVAPRTEYWGDRMCVCTDPEGYRWTFATNVGDFDPSKAPGATGGAPPA